MPDSIAESGPFVVGIIRFVMKEACQSGIYTDIADLFHLFLTRNYAVKIYPDDPDHIVAIRFTVIECALVLVMPCYAGIHTFSDLHIRYAAPHIPVITRVCNIDASVKIHRSDFLSSHF